ncbi:serine/threonine-protein kinase [Nocardia sp. BMG111209]|uniref:serine/threonine-protein kinase n=1 Tax=Nocardia sp. BMG111209 TaxID=1160137 RepID=UPI000362443A|nr:serine/threonine-protein kinase [Nocardia sp. BMG111209]
MNDQNATQRAGSGAPEPTSGRVVAGYRIERVLGAGGSGTVYLARHPRLPRSVALKVLHRADSGFRERFEREADLAARIDHPNVIEIYDRGEADGTPWIALRYVAGPDVARLVAQGPLPPPRAVALLAGAAAGLDAAHRHGLVHRDVKPANLLVGSDGGADHLVVTDFGIARSGDLTSLTASGTLVATLAYAAPEQLLGDAVDHRADIYSLGCTFYEMLTGTVPFARASAADTVRAHLNDPPPQPSRTRPGLPEAFDTVIATALAKDPADRYDTCAALASAARQALDTIPARPPTGPNPYGQNVIPPYGATAVPSRIDTPVPPGPVAGTSFPHRPPAPSTPGRGWPPPGGSMPVEPFRSPSGPIPERPAARRNLWVAGAAAIVVVVAAAIATATLLPGRTEHPIATTTPTPTPSPAVTTTTAPATSTRPAVTAWGRDNDLVALFPGLLPTAPDLPGYQGAQCSDTDVLNNGSAPAVECKQDNGLEWTVWSFRRGDPRRDSTFQTNLHDASVVEQPWSRPSGTGRIRTGYYSGGNLGWATIEFDDPARAWVVIDLQWGSHPGTDIADQWWTPAPL